ncbi:hypothetical protein RMN57_03170 [Kitasatospora sp. CM 4170]|uniref:Uncharacterized protein n=1 Tax=Kitasatospora aburaviensis TaxID=67265 RepID=A0ABW1EWW0_9ACTN|nr:hypothetical protein [Kitasatospora sp. CM 4170]WNM43774.1 hypothetical protein RMN57_03170 [Kitasatospora sp. CM 4170]
MSTDPGRRAVEPNAGAEELVAPGSIRHSLIELAVAAVLAEILFGLVGGLPAAAAGAVLFALAALPTARYVAGAGFLDVGLRRRSRLMDSHEPGLGDWRWTVRQGLAPDGDVQPLRGRLQRLFAARLSEAHNLSLADDRDRDRAADLIGPGLWPWIDPAAQAPAPTVPPDVLLALVDRLESL